MLSVERLEGWWWSVKAGQSEEELTNLHTVSSSQNFQLPAHSDLNSPSTLITIVFSACLSPFTSRISILTHHRTPEICAPSSLAGKDDLPLHNDTVAMASNPPNVPSRSGSIVNGPPSAGINPSQTASVPPPTPGGVSQQANLNQIVCLLSVFRPGAICFIAT